MKTRDIIDETNQTVTIYNTVLVAILVRVFNIPWGTFEVIPDPKKPHQKGFKFALSFEDELNKENNFFDVMHCFYGQCENVSKETSQYVNELKIFFETYIELKNILNNRYRNHYDPSKSKKSSK